MQSLLNRMFRQQLHPSIWKCKRDFNVAIDLTLIPYHVVSPMQTMIGDCARDAKIWDHPFSWGCHRFDGAG